MLLTLVSCRSKAIALTFRSGFWSQVTKKKRSGFWRRVYAFRSIYINLIVIPPKELIYSSKYVDRAGLVHSIAQEV